MPNRAERRITGQRRTTDRSESTGAGLRRRVATGLDALERLLGRPRRERRFPPLDELILTILSQNTTDTNRDRAFQRLRESYPTWEQVAGAPRRRIEAAIRVGGLAHTKSRVIKEVLGSIRRERGGFDLAFLCRLPAAEASAWLGRFRGVGDKTVACVLLFSCGLAAFPVDTHIHRVALRLGWLRPGSDRAEAHRRLADLVDSRRYFSAHVNLITLGRRLCRPHRPLCPSCPLKRGCRYAQERL